MSYLNDHRVSWEPAPAKSGDKVHLNYDGLLKNSGAADIYVHYGFDGWENAQTVHMSRNYDGAFTAEIPVQGSHEVNLCFKDCSNHWDNNSGWNWKIDVI